MTVKRLIYKSTAKSAPKVQKRDKSGDLQPWILHRGLPQKRNHGPARYGRYAPFAPDAPVFLFGVGFDKKILWPATCYMYIHNGGRITCFMSFHGPKITQKAPPPISIKQHTTLHMEKHETT